MFAIAGGIILAFFGLLIIAGIINLIGECCAGVQSLLDKIPDAPPVTNKRTWLDDVRDTHGIK